VQKEIVLYNWVRESQAQYKFVYGIVSRLVNNNIPKKRVKNKNGWFPYSRYRKEGCGLTVEQTTEERV